MRPVGQKREKQLTELARLVGQVPPEGQQRLDADKQEALQELLAQEGEENDNTNAAF